MIGLPSRTGGVDENMEADLRTLFVRCIPANVNAATLKDLFEPAGKVLNCFLVKNGEGKGGHRGYGFVEFLKATDAKKAVEKFAGTKIGDRELKVELARRRESFKDRKERKKRKIEEIKLKATTDELEVKEERGGKQLSGIFSDNLVQIRTVVVGGITDETAEVVKNKANKAGQVEEILYPAPEELMLSAKLEQDGCAPKLMLIAYKTVKQAMDAIAKLHGLVVNQDDAQPVSKPKQKRKKMENNEEKTESVENSVKLWCRQLSGEGAHLKKHRVIIRNLPFKAKDKDIEEALKPAGFVWKVDIPLKDNGHVRGFAFATFISNSHAQKAITLCNGKEICGRVVAIDWAIAKKQYDKQMMAQTEDDSKSLGDLETEADADKMVNSVVKSFVAQEEGSEDEASSSESELEEMSEDDMPSAKSDSGSDSGRTGSDSDEEDQEDEEDGFIPLPPKPTTTSPETKTNTPPSKTAKNGPSNQERVKADAGNVQKSVQNNEEGLKRTVFVRGLSLDCPEHLLRAEMERFGPLRTCCLVMNQQTQKPKGTGFVEFLKEEDAHTAIETAKEGGKGTGPGVSIFGAQLFLSLAVSREAAKKLAVEKAVKEKKDKRSLYLSREGNIEQGSVVWNTLSESDKAKRHRALNIKRQKLANPNFFVSRTRLCIRNLPKSFREKQLKKLFVDAVKKRAKTENPVVKQVKILFADDAEKSQKAAKSQCRGFVEFVEHDHALTALRELNANPHTFGPEKRPIVEFAIENAKALQLRDIRKARREEKQKELDGQDGGGDNLNVSTGNTHNGTNNGTNRGTDHGTDLGGSVDHVSGEEVPRKVLKWKKYKDKLQERRKEKFKKLMNRKKGQEVETQKEQKPGGVNAKGGGTGQSNGVVVGTRTGKRKAKTPKQAPQTVKQEGTPPQKKKRNKNVNVEKHDRLDGLVADYKSRYFGSGAKGNSGRNSAFMKWFQ